MTDNVSDIGAMREQRINSFNEFIFVSEDTLLGLPVGAAAACPELDMSDIAAGPAAFIVHTA